MTSRHTDILVLGGGTMGTAAGWAAARAGHSVRVLERYQHVHTFGSHSGISRIFRHAYAEGPAYVPWALAADEAWHALQDRSGIPMIHRVGCLDMAEPGCDHAQAARTSAITYALEHEWLTGADVRHRWPVWNVPDDWEVVFSPRAGYVEVEPGLKAMAAEMAEAGGVLETDCRATAWRASDGGVEVDTSDGTFSADRLVVTAGAWNVHMLRELGLPLEVRRKPVLWFRSSQPETIQAEVFPCFIGGMRHAEFYGLPQVGVPGIKAGVHSGGVVSDPETLDREIHEQDVEAEIGPYMRRYVHGITGELEQTSVCMYTMTPDEHFLIDRHLEHANVVFGAGFSGHGFKFTPVIGEHLVELATDAAAAPKELFRLDRFVTNIV